jgi:hypothetical protein
MLIPPFFIDCVAALGNERPIPRSGDQPPQNQWATTGTGFFYGSVSKPEDDPAKRQYEVFLATAKHVVQLHGKQNLDIRVRLNSKDVDAPVRDFILPRTIGPGYWHCHPNEKIDLAVIPMNWEVLKEQKIEPAFFTNDVTAANRTKLKDREVAAGDGIFVLGFPMGLTGAQRNYVVVRQGCIARISEMLDGPTPEFLIDAPVYPGNSGGPVVLRPEFMAIEGTKAQETATLLGIVTSYRPYEEIAVSLQTNQPRIIFQENSGLASVLPVDFIDETIADYRSISAAVPPVKPEIASELS